MSLRTPREQYAKKNGFDDFTKRFPTEQLKEAEATEAQDVARFVIREMGSFFPSLDDMKEEIGTADTVASLTERIKRLKKENQDNMAKLSAYYAQELYDDAVDRYVQTDAIKYYDFDDFTKSSDEWAQHYARLETFLKQNDKIVASEHSDLVARMQYDHLRELLPLYARRRELEKKEEMTRELHDVPPFPQSINEYHMLNRKRNGKQVQLVIARFLMSDETTRTNIRTRCHWTRTQTEPLITEHKNNLSFRTEIEVFVSQNESVDPRVRRAGA